MGENGIARLWIAAAAVAALGTWMCYDALPGINWLFWTIAASTGLILFVQGGAKNRKPVIVIVTIAIIIAGGAAVSGDEIMNFFTLLSVLLLLAIAMLLSVGHRLERVTAGFTIAAPIVAFGTAIVTALRRAADATELVRSSRARAVLRGLAITIPVLIVFALLLSNADPVFALWRNSVADLFANWDFLPRTIFFIGLFVITLGAYGHAAASRDATSPDGTTSTPNRWLGSAERLMLLGGVAGLLWLFMAIQLSYLFGNLPQVPGSGVTFAEYARRGFGEMTVVASASALLIIASERYGARNGHDRILRTLTLALIVAVLLLLGSAFNRVMLYEAAYGFTTARLYAQAFMLVVAAALIALTIEVMGELQAGRLFRRIAAVATIVLVSLIYWNHQAWIARLNIERFAVTGKLDASYLVRDLGLNAVPAVVAALPSLPEPKRSELRGFIENRYQGRHRMFDRQWYEWNRGRAAARAALESIGVNLDNRVRTEEKGQKG